MSNVLTPATIAKIDRLIEKSNEEKLASLSLAAPAVKQSGLVEFLKKNWPTAKPILTVLRTFAFFKPSWQKWLDVFIGTIDMLLAGETV